MRARIVWFLVKNKEWRQKTTYSHVLLCKKSQDFLEGTVKSNNQPKTSLFLPLTICKSLQCFNFGLYPIIPR